ncbi:type II CAAX endopeptidase family protein [uncultured Christiangramia sp.]|uniref:CPBP family intramembrane glutamic endopeptidase n=1 Tax=uncultured Christiangramia sp. TaxID=503836 RepID=UPI0026383FCC|nr:type II CAAX endopeptidase family protein [uncultured Christiangramia sp.]
MRLTKALLLTLLLIIIFLLVQIGVFGLLELFDQPISLQNPHQKWISKILGFVISYFFLFKVFWKVEILNKLDSKLNNYKISILIYLIILSIGLELIYQPLFDVNKLIEFYKNGYLNPEKENYSINQIDLLYQIVTVILITPLLEELFFRKFLISKLLKKNKEITSILISSFCFAIIHIETPLNLIPSFIFGVLSGLIFIKTRKILYSIFFHILMNSYYLIFLINASNYNDWIYNLNFDYIYWSLIIFGSILTFVGMKKITTANNGSSQITGIDEKV